MRLQVQIMQFSGFEARRNVTRRSREEQAIVADVMRQRRCFRAPEGRENMEEPEET